MEWIIVIIGLMLAGILTQIHTHLGKIIDRINDVENAISDFENEFHDRFPRNE